MPKRLYLDWNASAPLHAAARQAMVEASELSGNPSSVHGEGRSLRMLVERARALLARHLDVSPRQVFFTSGATEAAALALSPVLRSGAGEMRLSRLLVSAAEHPCVLSGGRFDPADLEVVPVGADGVVDLAHLEAMLGAGGPAMVAVMAANNETGVIQPIAEIAGRVHAHGGVLVVDAVQAFCRLAMSQFSGAADFLLLSGHKIGAPAGVGALVCLTPGLLPQPVLKGGGQENHLRAGTENFIGIAGLAAVVDRMPHDGALWQNAGLRDFIENGIATICAGHGVAAPVVFGNGAPRLPNTSCLAVPGLSAETALIALDLAGIAASSGSACSSGKVRSSHVLAAMGVGEELARCALRISFGPDAGAEEARQLLGTMHDIVGRMAQSRAA